jgi:hypothetical protein
MVLVRRRKDNQNIPFSFARREMVPDTFFSFPSGVDHLGSLAGERVSECDRRRPKARIRSFGKHPIHRVVAESRGLAIEVSVGDEISGGVVGKGLGLPKRQRPACTPAALVVFKARGAPQGIDLGDAAGFCPDSCRKVKRRILLRSC